MRRSRSLLFAALVAVSSPAGCAEPLDTTRVVSVRGTLGEEIYRNVCERISSSELPTDVSGQRMSALCQGTSHTLSDGMPPPPRLAALDHDRARLVAALDAALPTDLHDDLRGFLADLLPLYDDGTIQSQTRVLANFVTELMTDRDTIGTLARLGQREGYLPLRLGLGVTRPVLGYPHFDDVARTVLAAVDTGGSANDEWNQMLRVAALSMASAGPTSVAPGERTTLDLTRELLFAAGDAFASGTPRWLVRRDARGIVLAPASGITVAAPFVDRNGDGLADVDPLGRFVDGSGALLDVATPFPILAEPHRTRDPYGRATAVDGSLLYQYMDMNPTFLAGVAREAHPWLDPAHPSLFDTVQGLSLLLGPRGIRTASFGTATLTYTGPDTSRGPFFDLLHATSMILARPEADDLLSVIDTLLADREPALAGVMAAGWYGSDSGDMHPAAALHQPNDFWDDVLAVAERMSHEPGMTEALLRAIGDPANQDLGGVTAWFMRYSDPVTFNRADVNGVPLPAGALRQLTDHTAPDTRANESLFQRSLLAIDDLNGVRVCNKAGAVLLARLGPLTVTWPLDGSGYAECELFEIDNVGEFYARSLIGEDEFVIKSDDLNAILSFLGDVGGSADDLLEQSSGITGLTTHPTPQALARLVFAQPPYGPPNDFVQSLVDETSMKRLVGGVWRVVPLAERHHDVVPAWEKTFHVNGHDASFLSALRPLMRVFVDHNPPGGHFYFGELIHALAQHWPSRAAMRTQRTDPTGELFSKQDDVRTYEPIVADLFDRGQIFQRLGTAIGTLGTITVHPGQDGVRALAVGTNVLLDPELSCRGGSCAKGTPLTDRDGRAWPCSNSGICWDGMGGRPRRYVSPMYLILDALHGFDDTWDANPGPHAKWLEARHTIANQLFRTSSAAGAERLTNRRAYQILRVALPFLRARLADHRAAGDIDAWARGLTARAETSMGSPELSTVLDFVQALRDDPDARMQLMPLAQYLFDESSSFDAFDSSLVGVADLLQVLSDDTDVVPLLHALSTALAPNARDAVSRPGVAVTTAGSTADVTLRSIRALDRVDDAHTLRRMLQGLVTIQTAPGADPVTPLETIIDVIGEVNRAWPGAGGTFQPEDYDVLLHRTQELLSDDSRGFERLYAIVANRTVH